MASGVWQIPKIPELRNKLLVMVALLGVYRFGVFIPNPGTNRDALKSFFGGDSGTLFDLYTKHETPKKSPQQQQRNSRYLSISGKGTLPCD